MTHWKVFTDPETKKLVCLPTADRSGFDNFMSLKPHFTIGLNWVPSFKLGALSARGLQKLLDVLKHRPNCNIVIHGLWMGTADRTYDLDVDTIPLSVSAQVEEDLFDIIRSDQTLGAFLYTNWSNILNWKVIDWDAVIISENNWDTYKCHFEIVIYQFIKHAMASGMSLLDYILKCKEMFHKVENMNIGAIFHSLVGGFRSNKKRFSLLNGPGHTVTQVPAKDLRLGFSNKAPERRIPCLCFKTYEAKAPEGRLQKVGRICCLVELKLKFDQNLEMMDHDVMYQCDFHPTAFDSHQCVLLNHRDRFILHEDTLS